MVDTAVIEQNQTAKDSPPKTAEVSPAVDTNGHQQEDQSIVRGREKVGFFRRWLQDAREKGFLEASGLRRANVLVQQTETILQRLDELPAEVPESEEEGLRAEIRQTEAKFGIETPAQRALEAALFIDPPYMRVAQLRGDEYPEEAFGITAWKGWVEARQMAREMKGPLSLDDLQGLHKVIAQGLLANGGEVRNVPIYQDYYTNPDKAGKPRTFTPEQVAVIEQNPLMKIYWFDQANRTGYFECPTSTDPEFYESILSSFTPEERDDVLADQGGPEENLVRGLMKRFLIRYNEKIPETQEAIIAKAASLQQEFVAIHPFFDANGRLSRLLMNAYLEKADLDPALVEDSEHDLFYIEESWAQEITKGQNTYAELKKRAQENPSNQREVFFERDFLDVFDQLSPYLEHPPTLNSSAINWRKHREYVEHFSQLYGEFKKFVDQVSLPGIDTNVVQRLGGLIPSEYIETWGDTRPDVQGRVRSEFYYPQEVYRGAPTALLQEPRDLLGLFTDVPLEGAAYRTFTASNNEHRPVTVGTIQEVLRTYNKILASDFSRRESADVSGDPAGLENSEKALLEAIGNPNAERALQALREGTYMGYVIQSHKGIGTPMENPAYPLSLNVSTALERSMSESYIKGGRKYNAVMITALLPKFGTYYDMSLSSGIPNISVPLIERSSYIKDHAFYTFYTPGGIDPNAINAVTFYDKERNPVGLARREEDGTLTLIDGKNGFVERYVFDQDGKLRLSGQRPLEDADRDVLSEERLKQ